jgi:hypothetical protein
MTKTKKKSSIAAAQLSIFDFIRQAAEQTTHSTRPARGSLDMDKELRAALSDDLRHAKSESGRELSRAEVAARMSDLTGEEITLSTLNNWTAPSHPHSIPAKFIAACVRATGGRAAFEAMSRNAGLFALPGPEALRAEIQRYDEEMKKLKDEKSKRVMYLKEMEKPKEAR